MATGTQITTIIIAAVAVLLVLGTKTGRTLLVAVLTIGAIIWCITTFAGVPLPF